MNLGIFYQKKNFFQILYYINNFDETKKNAALLFKHFHVFLIYEDFVELILDFIMFNLFFQQSKTFIKNKFLS